MTDNAWSRWGPDDERGALNLIGPNEVKRATALVQTGEVLRLSQLLSSKTPVPGHRCGLQHFMNRDGGDYAVAGSRRPGGCGTALGSARSMRRKPRACRAGR